MADRRRRSVAVSTAAQLQHQLARSLLTRPNNKLVDAHGSVRRPAANHRRSQQQETTEPIAAIDWESIRLKSLQRGDSNDPCSICQEQFGLHQQTLLSCSHTFHQACLKSYERFLGKLSCPLCRCTDYASIAIFEAARIHRERCAVKLQCWWRCRREWRRYQEYRRCNPPKDPRLRQRFFQNKVQNITDRLTNAADIEADSVRTLVQQLNSSMSAVRSVFDQIDRFECEHSCQIADILADADDDYSRRGNRQNRNSLQSSTAGEERQQEVVDWNSVYRQACERDFRECPICMMRLAKRSGDNGRSLALLSCGHVFHGNCIGNFERFRTEDGGHSFTCPCCRQRYQKRLFDSLAICK